jgi:hypothetical protein
MRREAAGGLVPQFRQRSPAAGRHEDADLALEPEQMPGQALAAVVLDEAVDHLVDDPGQALHVAPVAGVAQQHQWKIVAQRRQVAVPREQCGACVRAGRRFGDGAGLPAGPVEGDLRLQFCVHLPARLVG